MASLATAWTSATEPLPEGEVLNPTIEPGQVLIPEQTTSSPEFDDEAAATLAVRDYETARAWLENNLWYAEWEASDLLYQSPTQDYANGSFSGTPRVSDFTVNDACSTMVGEVNRQLFAQQVPFVLRPRGKTTQIMVEAWTALLEVLLDRMDFEYHLRLGNATMGLQGTQVQKVGWHTRTYKRKVPKRKGMPQKADLPIGGETTVPTTESDTFEMVDKDVTESWPFIEYRELGSTLFDPKWNTPMRPDLCGFSVDVDDVNFDDLEGMQQLECYKEKLPSREALIAHFFQNPEGTASPASESLKDFTSDGSPVLHAQGGTINTSVNPLDAVFKMITRWDKHRVIGVLLMDEKTFTIRNEPAEMQRGIPHFTANWRSIQNSGWGVGLGRLVGCQQRVKQGVINHGLWSLAYTYNAPLVHARGIDAPTQNVQMMKGGFFPVTPIGNNVLNAVGFLPVPEVPADTWRFLAWGDQSADSSSGANDAFAQGDISKRGSSAARTATGAAAVSAKSNQRAAEPVDNVSNGIIIPVIDLLIEMVKMQKMPVQEIREVLEERLADKLTEEFDFQEFFDARLETRVLAGQKLAAKQGIAQVLPFLTQIAQQPDVIQKLHDRGETMDIGVIVKMMIDYSELNGQYDIIRPLTPEEDQKLQQGASNPKAAEAQTKIQVEQLRGQNKLAEVQEQGKVDLTTKLAEQAIEKLGGGVPLERAEGFNERKEDEQQLTSGIGGGL